MKNNYIVTVNGYSLDQFNKKVNTFLYGENSVVPMKSDIPFYHEIIDSSEDSITWGLEYEGQSRRCVNELRKILSENTYDLNF